MHICLICGRQVQQLPDNKWSGLCGSVECNNRLAMRVVDGIVTAWNAEEYDDETAVKLVRRAVR